MLLIAASCSAPVPGDSDPVVANEAYVSEYSDKERVQRKRLRQGKDVIRIDPDNRLQVEVSGRDVGVVEIVEKLQLGETYLTDVNANDLESWKLLDGSESLIALNRFLSLHEQTEIVDEAGQQGLEDRFKNSIEALETIGAELTKRASESLELSVVVEVVERGYRFDAVSKKTSESEEPADNLNMAGLVQESGDLSNQEQFELLNAFNSALLALANQLAMVANQHILFDELQGAESLRHGDQVKITLQDKKPGSSSFLASPQSYVVQVAERDAYDSVSSHLLFTQYKDDDENGDRERNAGAGVSWTWHNLDWLTFDSESLGPDGLDLAIGVHASVLGDAEFGAGVTMSMLDDQLVFLLGTNLSDGDRGHYFGVGLDLIDLVRSNSD